MTVKESEYPELLADWKELVNMDVCKRATSAPVNMESAAIHLSHRKPLLSG